MAAYGHRPVRRHPSHDYAAALTWYERLLGSPPAFFPNDIEAVWELAEHRYLFIEQRPEHAGHAMQTFFVDDFDALIAQITDRGVEPTERETYSNGVRKTTYCDPDGNEVGFGGRPSARNQPRPGGWPWRPTALSARTVTAAIGVALLPAAARHHRR
jgi:hypothetical protein